jgi:hypothetical protein
VSFAAPFAPWVLVALLLAAAALSWAAYSRAGSLSLSRRACLIALRLVAFLLVLVLLMRPVRVTDHTAQTGAVVPVLIDASRSMALPAGDGRSRVETAVAVARTRILPALSSRFAVEPMTFGEALEEADLQRVDPRAASSDLATALADVRHRFAGRPVAGVVVLSDGAVTEPATASGTGLPPVFTIGVGPAIIANDREVVSVTMGEPHISESIVDLVATVVSHGGTGDALDVRLLQDGLPIDVQRVLAPASGAPSRLAFRVSPRRDTPTVYTVDIAPSDGEVTLDNNRQSILAPPAGAPRRLLLLQGAPGFDHSFLKRTWDQDPGLVLDSIVRKGRNEQGAPTFYVQAGGDRARSLTAGFPAGREALFAYDGVVFANYGIDALTRDQVDMLIEFVAERGGGLLLLGARSFDARSLAGSPMEALLPWHPTDRSGDVQRASLGQRAAAGVTLSAEGRQHPVMRIMADESGNEQRWAGAPQLAPGAPVGGPRPGASVLAVTAGGGGAARPLVAVQRYGRGRVLAFSGEASFRWKMMLPSTDRLYDAFWRQAGRWVAVASPGRIQLDLSGVADGQRRASVTVVDAAYRPVRDAGVQVTVTGPEGAPHTVAAALSDPSSGRYAFELPAGVDGVYRVEAAARRGTETLGQDTGWALVGGIDREMADPRRQDAVLQRIARATGGRFLRPEELGELPALISAGVTTSQRSTERDVWHNGWAFLALIGCLAAEWTLRRRWGLR